MTSSQSFIDSMKVRRTIYQLSKESTIPDARVEEIIKDVILHTPSSYNCQSARAVVLLGAAHEKLWDIGAKHMKQMLGDEKFAHFEGRIKGFRGAYGSVVFFEDQEALDKMAKAHPDVASMVQEWSMQSAGMHHYNAWTALSAEGLGCNLQHFNFHPLISQDVKKELNLPDSWNMHAQLVFGKPAGEPMKKNFDPIEERVKVVS